MKKTSLHAAMKLLWCSDIHLDRAENSRKVQFLERLAAAGHDGVVITGDISDSKSLVEHLSEIGRACKGRPVFFVLGNHDHYQGSIRNVESAVDALCQRSENLYHLGKGEIIPIGNSTALLGHRGWSDHRAGFRHQSCVSNPDRHAIGDFRELSTNAYFHEFGA